MPSIISVGLLYAFKIYTKSDVKSMEEKTMADTGFYVDYGADECCEDKYLNNPRVIKISRLGFSTFPTRPDGSSIR